MEYHNITDIGEILATYLDGKIKIIWPIALCAELVTLLILVIIRLLLQPKIVTFSTSRHSLVNEQLKYLRNCKQISGLQSGSGEETTCCRCIFGRDVAKAKYARESKNARANVHTHRDGFEYTLKGCNFLAFITCHCVRRRRGPKPMEPSPYQIEHPAMIAFFWLLKRIIITEIALLLIDSPQLNESDTVSIKLYLCRGYKVVNVFLTSILHLLEILIFLERLLAFSVRVNQRAFRDPTESLLSCLKVKIILVLFGLPTLGLSSNYIFLFHYNNINCEIPNKAAYLTVNHFLYPATYLMRDILPMSILVIVLITFIILMMRGKIFLKTIVPRRVHKMIYWPSNVILDGYIMIRYGLCIILKPYILQNMLHNKEWISSIWSFYKTFLCSLLTMILMGYFLLNNLINTDLRRNKILFEPALTSRNNEAMEITHDYDDNHHQMINKDKLNNNIFYPIPITNIVDDVNGDSSGDECENHVIEESIKV